MFVVVANMFALGREGDGLKGKTPGFERSCCSGELYAGEASQRENTLQS